MATKYWSGTGTWNAGNTNWATSSGGTYNQTFNDGDDAVFEGTAGTVTVSSPNNPNSITFTVTGYTLSGGTVTFYANPCTFTLGTGISATISSVLAGSIKGLTKAGDGTLTLSGANTYNYPTYINAGILKVGHATALGTGGTYDERIVVSSGAALDLNGTTITNVTNAERIEIAGTGVSSSGAITNSNATAASVGAGAILLTAPATIKAASGDITLAGEIISWSTHRLTVSGSFNTALNGVIATTGLTKAGDGTLTLGATNTYGAPTSIEEGAVSISAVPLNSANGPFGNWSGAASLVLGTASTVGTVIYTGVAATWVREFSVAGGTGGGTIINAGSGTLTISSGSIPVASGGALTLDGASGKDIIVSGVIGTASTAGKVTKTGANTVTLSGANIYTGTTTVSAGTLLVNGSTGTSAVTVASGATLGGTGTIGGAVTISSGGIVAPGSSSAATLTISKASATALALNSTSVLTYTLGTAQDKIVLSGASSNLTLDGTINVTSGAGFAAGTYDIITYQGTLTNNTLVVGSMPSGFAATVNIDSGNKKVQLVVTGQAATLFNNRNYMNNYASMGVR